MPWTENNYPNSWKNLDDTTRRKALDIANAMLKEGYDDDQAIPIATAQAKKWAEDATQKEKNALKHKNISDHKNTQKSKGADYIERDVHVRYRNQCWEVITEGAQQPSETFPTKKEAQKRAQKIAENRGTNVISHKKTE